MDSNQPLFVTIYQRVRPLLHNEKVLSKGHSVLASIRIRGLGLTFIKMSVPDQPVSISSSMPTNPTRLSFFTLPAELCNVIYEALFNTEAPVKLYMHHKSPCGECSPTTNITSFPGIHFLQPVDGSMLRRPESFTSSTGSYLSQTSAISMVDLQHKTSWTGSRALEITRQPSHQ